MYNSARMSIEIQVYTGGPCACNGYLVRGAKGYVAVDAPLGFTEWVAKKLPADAQVTDLLITLQHFDHVQDAAALAQRGLASRSFSDRYYAYTNSSVFWR